MLEYLEGETLAKRLEKGPLPTNELLKTAMQIADGLDNHRVMILDRDLKYLGEFGGNGKGPGQFSGVHAVVLETDGSFTVVPTAADGVDASLKGVSGPGTPRRE